MTPLYPSDLSDAEWDRLHRLLPPRSPHARLRRHSLRSVFDALFYLLRTGCPWRYLPATFPPWQTVYYHFRQLCRTGVWTHLWRELRTAERRRLGKDAHPSAAIVDSQSVKTVEESARTRGFDAHTHVKGRKRHILVDTLGLPLAIYVTPADRHDTQGARRLLAGLKYFGPRLTTIWADAAYRGQELVDWCKAEGEWDLHVVERAAGVRGFAVVPKRWIVERTFGWLSRYRRMSKDYERNGHTSETLIAVAMSRLVLARLGRQAEPPAKHAIRKQSLYTS
jgi:putative transposase